MPASSSRGATYGLLAAALFGVSAPLAKLLLPSASPLSLAGLLYLGAAAALWGYSAAVPRRAEARLRRADLPALAGVILLGGVVGPVCLLVGLSTVSGVAGALALNLEGPLTMLVAITVFQEHLGRRELLAALGVMGAAALLTLPDAHGASHAVGLAFIALACLAWALDNNLTQRLSLRDPVAVVRVKALGAGGVSVALALALGEPFPPPSTFGWALLVGALSYGLSVVLDVYGLRILGAAREAAFFATAPFIGAVASTVLLGERLGAKEAVAMAVMAGCVTVLLRERHGHAHAHDPMDHDHAHLHDAHHQHEHPAGTPPWAEGESHAHPHRHAPLVHDHPHLPDLHHRHRH